MRVEAAVARAEGTGRAEGTARTAGTSGTGRAAGIGGTDGPARAEDAAEAVAPRRAVAGWDRVAAAALVRVARAIAAEALDVPGRAVRARVLDDGRGALAVDISGPLSIAPLGTHQPRQESVIAAAHRARGTIAERVAAITGRQVARVTIVFTSSVIVPPKRVR